MKILQVAALLLATAQAMPWQAPTEESRAVSAGAWDQEVDETLAGRETLHRFAALFKRKGGGGGKSGGGSGSGGSSPKSGSGSGSGSSGGSSKSPGSTSSQPSIGGGRYFPGGASTSYVAGQRSPSGISPSFLPGAAIGFGLGALWFYPYHTVYPYYTNPNTHRNESLPVECVCQPDDPCGCDDSNNATAIQEMLKNDTIAKVENVNGTDKVVINGTLLNDTSDSSAAAALLAPGLAGLGSAWPVAVVVGTMMLAV